MENYHRFNSFYQLSGIAPDGKRYKTFNVLIILFWGKLYYFFWQYYFSQNDYCRCWWQWWLFNYYGWHNCSQFRWHGLWDIWDLLRA